MSALAQTSLPVHVAGWTPIDLAFANNLLADWDHYLGPVNRPFGSEAWAFDIEGEPVSVAVSSSTVSSTVAGYLRGEVVELARLCSAPDARWATRPALRLWREVAGPRWPYWPVRAAVAYSQNGRHDGQIYRFDGWERISTTAGGEAGANSTWTKPRSAEHPARGPKTLWLWRYETAIQSAEAS